MGPFEPTPTPTPNNNNLSDPVEVHSSSSSVGTSSSSVCVHSLVTVGESELVREGIVIANKLIDGESDAEIGRGGSLASSLVSSSLPAPSLPTSPIIHIPKPILSRGNSVTNQVSVNETRRQTLAEMVSQIEKYDPYPCVLGIPMMPALFATSKFYLFIFFSIIGLRVCVAASKQM